MDLICKSSSLKCSFIDSIFYSKLKENDIESLRKWCNVNNDFDLLFFPINIESSHWSLIVFDCKNLTVNNYDSFFKPNLSLVKFVSKALSQVFSKLKNCCLWKFNTFPDCPKQKINSNDCGVYICSFAKSLAFCKSI